MENLRKEEEEEEVLYFYRAERDSSPRRLNETGGENFSSDGYFVSSFPGCGAKNFQQFREVGQRL